MKIHRFGGGGYNSVEGRINLQITLDRGVGVNRWDAWVELVDPDELFYCFFSVGVMLAILFNFKTSEIFSELVEKAYCSVFCDDYSTIRFRQ